MLLTAIALWSALLLITYVPVRAALINTELKINRGGLRVPTDQEKESDGFDLLLLEKTAITFIMGCVMQKDQTKAEGAVEQLV